MTAPRDEPLDTATLRAVYDYATETGAPWAVELWEEVAAERPTLAEWVARFR